MAATLRLKRPYGLTPVFTAFFLIAFFVALELFLRAEPVQPYLARLIRSLGGRHLQLEEQLSRLDRVAYSEGHVDCIFLGSSLVWLGFNPPTFEDAFLSETGQKIRCFNLGIEALPTNAASMVAKVAVERYHPWLLLYGTSARDYAIDVGEENSQVVLETPALQYELGRRTPATWLVTNSYVLRYAREVGKLLRFDEKTWSSVKSASYMPNGFFAKVGTATERHTQAAAKDAAQWLHPYKMLPANLEGLSAITRLSQTGTQVIVVEMPVSREYYSYFEQGKKDYDQFVSQIASKLSAEGTIFLSPPMDLILKDGWWEASHMNTIGANIFSQWLAREVDRLMRTSQIKPPETVVKYTGQ